MKSLDEAIQHCLEVAEENEHDAKEYDSLAKLETYPSRKECESAYKICRKCAEDHRQLAEWLRELKAVYELLDESDDGEEIFIGWLREKMKGEYNE